MSSSRRVSLDQVAKNHGVLRRSPRRLRTKTPSVNELSKKFKVSPKGKRRLEFKPQEPLKGLRFYLDLQCFRKSKLLVCRINDLGGKVEDFLSKDVSLVITNRKDVDTQGSAHSPSTPSPGMSVPSPIPGARSSSMKGPSPLSVDSPNSVEPKHDTRGKALMKKATGTQITGTSGVLANVRTWGVELMQLDKFLEKLEQYEDIEKEGSKPVPLSNLTVKLSSKPTVRKLNAPFIKVEDHSHHFKPLVHELKEWPRIYFDTPVGTCPFDPPKRRERGSQVKRSHKKRGQEEKQQKQGYCECCCSHYKDLDQHLRSDHHQTFARDDSNYVSLDAVISKGPSLKAFLDKVRGKHHEKAQRQGHDREDNLDASSQDQTPEAPSISGERSNELPNETTPVQTPQGSELNSDEGVTRVTRSRSRSQKCDETPPDVEQAGGPQLESSKSPLEGKATSDNAASSVKDASQCVKGEESHDSKPVQDEESPTIRITRSAKVCPTSASPQQSVMGVPLSQNADSKEVQQPKQSGKSGSAVKGDGFSNATASDHCSGDFGKPQIDKEPSSAEAVRMTRLKKNSTPSVMSDRHNSTDEHDSGKEKADLLGCPIPDGLPEGTRSVTLHEEDELSDRRSGDDKSSKMSQVNPAIECNCEERFTKITRAKGKAFSKENGEGLFTSDSNAIQSLTTKNENSDGPPVAFIQQDDVPSQSFTKITCAKAKAFSKENGQGLLASDAIQSLVTKNESLDGPPDRRDDATSVTSADTSIFGRKISSPRLMVFSTMMCAEETKEADESCSDKTESIELSEEPSSNTIKTQSMQVMLKNTLIGTSSSTVTIIGSCDESAGNKERQSDRTDDESIEPPREYPLRNRSGLSVKGQTKDNPLGWESLLRGIAGCPIGKKDMSRRREKKTVSIIGAKLRGGNVLDSCVCHATQRTKNEHREIAPKEREPFSSSDSPRRDFSSGGETGPAPCSNDSRSSGSSPRSGPSPAIHDTAKSLRGVTRAILEEIDEEECMDEGTSVKKQRKATWKRRTCRIILSDVSDSDSCNDSLVAHHGTPQTRQDPVAVQVSCEPAGDISSQKGSPPSVSKPDDVHNGPDQDEEWNIGDKLTLSVSKLGTRKERTLSHLFDSNDDEEEFYGFDVPHFDQSMSSEQDLSFHIESIVENMAEKEPILSDPFDPMSCEGTRQKSGERESTRALASDCPKRARRNEKTGLKDEEERSSGSEGKCIDAPRPGNAPTFERDQETGKCLNRDLLDCVVRFGKDYLKKSSTEVGGNEVDVCEDGDSSSTVADSTDGEDEELPGLSPRIELNFRSQSRKREAEPEFDDDTEIELPVKRIKSQDGTCEQSSPPAESSQSSNPNNPSMVKGDWRKPQEPQPDPEDDQPQEACKEIEACNADNNETNAAATDSDQPQYQQIQQDVVFSEQLNMINEIVYETLEERVKLRRSKPTQGRETVGKDRSKAELENKSWEGRDIRRTAGKGEVPQELKQNAKKSQEHVEGRRNGRRTPKAGVGKNAKTGRVGTNSRSASASEVGLERLRMASASTLSDSRNKVEPRHKRPPSREGGDSSQKVALRPLRPLRRRAESTSGQALRVSKTLKPLKPLPPLRPLVATSVESGMSSPSHSTESSQSSCTIPTSRPRSSGSWIFNTGTCAPPCPTQQGNKTVAGSIPLLATPGRGSLRGDGNSSRQLRCLPSLRKRDQYDFMNESGDVFDFRG